MSEIPEATGVDLARVALAAARAAAKERPAGRAKRKTPARASSRRGSGRDPITALEAVKQMLIDRGYEVPAAAGTVVGQWAAIVPDFAEATAAEAFDADTGTLSVRPASPAYATQLRLSERAIVARINDRMGRPVVKSLRILSPQPGTRAQPEDTRVAPGRSHTGAVPPQEQPAGYRQAKTVLTATPAAAPDPLPAAVRRAVAAQDAALREKREPRARFADGVASQTQLAAQAAAAEDPYKRARAYARAEKVGRATAVPRAFDQTA